MAERILYGHVSGISGTGYRIRARSNSPQSVEDFRVNEFVQKLRLRPEELFGGTGWYWMELDSTRKILGVVRVLQSDTGVQTLEYRFAILSHDECDRLGWQPFHLRDQMLADDSWSCVDGNVLPQLQIPEARSHTKFESGACSMFSVSWELAGRNAGELLEAHLDSVTPEARRAMAFLAPDVRTRGNPRISLFSSGSMKSDEATPAKQSSSYGRSISMAAGAVLCCGLMFSNFLAYSKYKEAQEHAADRDLAYRNLTLGAQDRFDERKETEPVPGEDPNSRLAIDSLTRLGRLFNAIYREPSSDAARERDNNGIRYYLEMQGGSSDHKASFLAALDKWIAIERMQNTQTDLQLEQRRLATQMQELLYELRGLVIRLNQQKMRFSVNQSEAGSAESELFTKIGENTDRLKSLMDDFEANTNSR